MGLIQFKRPWDRQPQEHSRIDPQWRDGLLSLYNGGTGFFDLASQQQFTLVNGQAAEVGSKGIAARGNASSQYAYSDHTVNAVDSVTIIAMVSHGTPDTDKRAYSAADRANTQNYIAIGTGTAGNESKCRVGAVVGNSSGTFTHTTADVFDGGSHCVALRWRRAIGTQSFVDGGIDSFAANTTVGARTFNRATISALGRSTFSVHWGGLVYLGATFIGRDMSDDELQFLTARPYSLFAPQTIWVPVSAGGGGGTNLTVADAAHAHTLDSVVLTSSIALVVQDMAHAHALDAATLSTGTVLMVSDAQHAHALGNVTLSTTGAVSLAVADLLHGHALDAVVLTSQTDLVAADLAHGHALDGVTVTLGGASLVAADIAHGHTLDGAALTLDTFLAVDDAVHGHTLDNIVLAPVGTDADISLGGRYPKMPIRKLQDYDVPIEPLKPAFVPEQKKPRKAKAADPAKSAIAKSGLLPKVAPAVEAPKPAPVELAPVAAKVVQIAAAVQDGQIELAGIIAELQDTKDRLDAALVRIDSLERTERRRSGIRLRLIRG